MATRGSKMVRGSMVVVALALASVVVAQTLPRLPEELALRRGEGSPGKVTFSHRTHVDQQRPNCTICHPVLFKMLGGDTRAGEASYHAAMDKGRRCGACHHGAAAFGLDNCPACHRAE